MDGRMAAQSLCVALQLQWMVAVAMGGSVETVVIDNGGNSAMDGRMAAQLQWAMVVAMRDSGCHDGRQQQRQHDCDRRQWWRRSRQWDSGAIVMETAMNSGGSDRRTMAGALQ
jgi:hypothetical protein